MKITELFERGEFVVSAEVGPPKGFHVDHLLEDAKKYLSGISAVNVTDNQFNVTFIQNIETERYVAVFLRLLEEFKIRYRVNDKIRYSTTRDKTQKTAHLQAERFQMKN